MMRSPDSKSPQVACACLLALAALSAVPSTSGRAQEFAPSLYVRTDSDHTTVISPRLRGSAPIGEATNVDLTYTVDIWTSASVDVVASASEPVTEQRDEIDVGVNHVFTDLTLSAGYRYSHEPDFVSNGGHVGASLDLASKSTTLAAGLAFSVDDVGRAGDPSFSEAAQTVGVQTTFTQVLDRDTLLQALYDIGRTSGYQASPYRWVGLGGDGRCGGTSGGTAPWCVPENNPEVRVRHAWAARFRRALGSHFSTGGGYRFYLDSWGLTSHTITGNLTWIPSAQTTVSIQYRGYLQSAADHYRPSYTVDDLGSFVTGDKELSPLVSQRVLVDLEQSWQLDHDTVLRTAASIGPTWYAYQDYLYLDSMVAIDVTGSAVLEF